MVIVDYFTKMKIFIPTTQKITSLIAADLFKRHAFKQFGIPKGVVSDRGTQFVSEFMKECIGFWESREWRLPHTTHKLMDKRKESTKNWKHISDSM